jgi:Protein of unknown function (DUF3606)
MRRQKRPLFRNKLDLADRTQVRVVSRRLRLSKSQLLEIVGRVGNSIAAISKEVALQRAAPSSDLINVAPAAAVKNMESEVAAEVT